MNLQLDHFIKKWYVVYIKHRLHDEVPDSKQEILINFGKQTIAKGTDIIYYRNYKFYMVCQVIDNHEIMICEYTPDQPENIMSEWARNLEQKNIIRYHYEL